MHHSKLAIHEVSKFLAQTQSGTLTTVIYTAICHGTVGIRDLDVMLLWSQQYHNIRSKKKILAATELLAKS